jgi:RHS repeat-associated protein
LTSDLCLWTYNPRGQLTRLLNQISGNTISDFSSIGYDGVGNRNSVTATIPGATSLSGVTGYTYDSKDQITQETSTRNGGFTDNFGYDAAGNPTNFKGVTKTYNSNNQQTATGFSYDGNGNPTTYAGNTLTFDRENRLTSYGGVLTAGYNGDGLRAWKQNVSGRTYFLYDGIHPVVELDAAGSVAATNTFGFAGLASRRAGTASFLYSFDSEGNVAQRSDGSGTVLSNYLFSAHGVPLNAALADPFGYKARYGYYSDAETGLQLLTYRYYDPSSGRFITRDAGDTWHWHPDPDGRHGGDHWDIGGPRGPGGEKGKQEWWPNRPDGQREPKPPGDKRFEDCPAPVPFIFPYSEPWRFSLPPPPPDPAQAAAIGTTGALIIIIIVIVVFA